MLSLLHIENIALIESADIQFEDGFNVLTGETGAGKSIVVDSISAVLGERTSRDLIRTGAKSASVSAVFTDATHLPWLREHGIEVDGNELILRREIRADGRTTCRVDNTPVTVTQLRELGRQLLNIHGQHDGQQLLDPACHLDYLDSFGKTAILLEIFQLSYQNLSAIRRRINGLQMNEAEQRRRVDALLYQIGEIERAELKTDEDTELDARKSLLRGAGKLTDAIRNAQLALSGDEEQDGACALIANAEGEMIGVSRYGTQFEALAGQLAELHAASDDVAERLRDMSREMDFSPEELEQIETRLDIIYRLKKKYGSTVADIMDYLNKCREELDQIEQSDDTLIRLAKEQEILHKKTVDSADALSALRKKGAENLRSRVETELRQLDMPKVQFQVQFALKSGEFGMDETGCDDVQFLMSANVGEAPKPIQKVASGGELARIMLALKNVLAEDDGIYSLVFDEVDSGVSGRAAQKVAQKMAQVAQNKQVLCVTHLPQIAAMADAHLQVEKGEQDGRTYTKVANLDRAQRRTELARLIGGTAITATLVASAEELLATADAFKQRK